MGEDPTKDKTETSRWEPTQQNCLLSVDRAVDRHAPLCMCAHRSTDRSTGSKSSALCFSQSTGPVDRQRVFTLCWDQRSTVRSTAFPTVRNPTVGGRPSGRSAAENFVELAPNGQILFCLLLGLLLTYLLGFLTSFSSPINRESMKQLNNKIYKPHIKFFKV